jgi:hypothetical protein
MTHHVRQDTVINASANEVWAVLANLESVQHYDSAIVKASYLTDKRSGVGAARRCDLPNNEYIYERVIAWDEGRSYAVEVYDDHSEEGWPCKDQIAQFKLADQGVEKTLVTIEYQYQIKPGVSLSEDEVKQMAEELLASVLGGLKNFVELEKRIPTSH